MVRLNAVDVGDMGVVMMTRTLEKAKHHVTPTGVPPSINPFVSLYVSSDCAILPPLYSQRFIRKNATSIVIYALRSQRPTKLAGLTGKESDTCKADAY